LGKEVWSELKFKVPKGWKN